MEVENPATSAPTAATQAGGEKATNTKKSTFGQGPRVRYNLEFINTSVRVVSKNLEIVKHVSGFVNAGSVLCVLGPSGCGKSTLLECLANLRRPNLKMTGKILFNSQHLSGSQRRQVVSFCNQDHSLLGEFTVEETLRCAARLYFGYREASDVVENKVKSVMQSMGLTESAHVRVGNLFFRGLSGGQKRRLAIGVELIFSPSIIVLDEPTSGLDSSASLGIMALMQDLASQGHTILASIHQPSSKIWSMITNVMFMSRGRCMYFGTSTELTSFLESINLPCPSTYSPVDFFIGAISTDFDIDADVGDANTAIEEGQVTPEEANSAEKDRIAFVENIATQFEQSEFAKNRFLYAAPATMGATGTSGSESGFQLSLPQSPKEEEDDEKEEEIKAGSRCNPCRMFGASYKSAGLMPNAITLLHRNLTSLYKNPGTLVFRLAFSLGLGLMFGTLFFDIGSSTDDVGLFGRTSVICGGIMFFAFLGLTSIPFIMEERATFVRERNNGMYRTSSYLIAKVVSMIAVAFSVTLLGTILMVYMCKMRNFGTFFLTMFSVVVCSEAFIQCFGTIFDTYETGMGVSILFYALYFLTAGFFVVFDRMNWAMRWLGFISPFRYSFYAGMRSEFEGITELPDSILFRNGQDMLHYYQIDGPYAVDSYEKNIAVLLGLFVVYTLLTYFALENRSSS